MELPMTMDEIRRDYREAADKKAQVKILAEQNLIRPWQMLQVLKDAGEDVDLRWYLSPEKRTAQREGRTRKPEWPGATAPPAPALRAERRATAEETMEAYRILCEKLEANMEVLQKKVEALRAERDELKRILTKVAAGLHRLVEEGEKD